VARAPSPAKVVLGLELRVHPQPAIIFRLLNQPCLYRILCKRTLVTVWTEV